MTINVYCRDHNNYPVSFSSWPAGYGSTQYVTHASTTVGLVIPNFVSTQNVGCPAVTFCISASFYNTASNCNQPSDLSTSPTVIGGNNVFTMTATGKH